MLPRLDAYLERLMAIPFIRRASVVKEQVRAGDAEVDALLEIETPSGTERMYCDVKTSNLSAELAAQLVTLSKQVRPLLIACPVIGSGLGDFLAQHHTSFVDLRGNCYLNLEGRYVARIQGQRGEQPMAPRALRAPSYHVLFTLLAHPELVAVPLRTVAESAGVSRQPAVTVRAKLEELGYILRSDKGYSWSPTGVRRALELWLGGYVATVRPALFVGAYRTEHRDPLALEQHVQRVLGDACVWRWGGGAAAHRLTGYFRGDKTVVHVAAAPANLAVTLRAVPDRHGPLLLLRSPGPAGFDGKTQDTAHPLLVYTELLSDGSERASEAANELAAKFSIGTGP